MPAPTEDLANGHAAPAPVFSVDALIIGAGPVGLFQVFQLGLHGVHAHVVDVRDQPGGQCEELYPDKPIYDIPGIPQCTGRELTQRLLQQIAPFQPQMHWGQEITRVERAKQCWQVQAASGQCWNARTLFLACGVGAFKPRNLGVPELDLFEGRQLHYRMPALHAGADRHVVVVGGASQALEWALHLCGAQPHRPGSGLERTVTLLHRRDVFDADAMLLQAMEQARASGRLQVCIGQIQGHAQHAGRLTALHVQDSDGTDIAVPADQVLVALGVSPRLGALAHWGLAMERRQLLVDTAHFATSLPGIFAVGDINTYPGKRKLILCGFHECTLAAYAAAALIHPQEPVALQYTTTNKRLHALLARQ